MRVLFAENEDSFSWNVIEALPLPRSAVEFRSGVEVARRPEVIADFDALVIGPGPKDPLRAGIVDLVRHAASLRLPMLGICLGHQALGLAFGAELIRSHPVHGRTSTALFGPSRCFPGVVGEQTVMRYHSLALRAVRAPLRVIAELEDGLPMAIEHDSLPMAGMQFHPDSYATPNGKAMIKSFFEAHR